jgi:hypothetical protein
MDERRTVEQLIHMHVYPLSHRCDSTKREVTTVWPRWEENEQHMAFGRGDGKIFATINEKSKASWVREEDRFKGRKNKKTYLKMNMTSE